MPLQRLVCQIQEEEGEEHNFSHAGPVGGAHQTPDPR